MSCGRLPPPQFVGTDCESRWSVPCAPPLVASTAATVIFSAVEPADPDTVAAEMGDELSSFTMLQVKLSYLKGSQANYLWLRNR